MTTAYTNDELGAMTPRQLAEGMLRHSEQISRTLPDLMQSISRLAAATADDHAAPADTTVTMP